MSRNGWDWVPMVDVFPKNEKKGEAEVQRFRVNNHQSVMTGLRAMINNRPHDHVLEGEYVRLGVDGELMMSDTRMEKRTNFDFVNSANGRVLIGGLGLGVALLPILMKKSVIEVVVVEKSKDVIDLVVPRLINYLRGKRRVKDAAKLTDVHEDIFEFEVPKREKFDTVFLDIWPNICEDNLDDVRRLKNKFKNRINRTNPAFFFKAWEEDELRRMKRRDRRRSYPFGF